MALQDILDEGLAGIQHNFLTGKLEDLVNWSRARSCWPATFGLACCAIEMMGTGAAHYDLARRIVVRGGADLALRRRCRDLLRPFELEPE